jgi:hypothetical protein
MYLRHEHAPRRHVTRHLGWGTYYGTQPRTCPTKAPNRALALLRHPTAHLLYSTTARDDALEVAALLYSTLLLLYYGTWRRTRGSGGRRG